MTTRADLLAALDHARTAALAARRLYALGAGPFADVVRAEHAVEAALVAVQAAGLLRRTRTVDLADEPAWAAWEPAREVRHMTPGASRPPDIDDRESPARARPLPNPVTTKEDRTMTSPGPVENGVRADLSALPPLLRDCALARSALDLAAAQDGTSSARDKASIARELRSTLTALRDLAGDVVPEDSVVERLRARRAARIDGRAS